MKANLLRLLALVMLASSTGCAICCHPHDYEYCAYGGRWERDDRCNGRVGSAFEPAGGIVGEDHNLGQPPAEVANARTVRETHWE